MIPPQMSQDFFRILLLVLSAHRSLSLAAPLVFTPRFTRADSFPGDLPRPSPQPTKPQNPHPSLVSILLCTPVLRRSCLHVCKSCRECLQFTEPETCRGADERLKQNREDAPLIAHLQGLHILERTWIDIEPGTQIDQAYPVANGLHTLLRHGE